MKVCKIQKTDRIMKSRKIIKIGRIMKSRKIIKIDRIIKSRKIIKTGRIIKTRKIFISDGMKNLKTKTNVKQVLLGLIKNSKTTKQTVQTSEQLSLFDAPALNRIPLPKRPKPTGQSKKKATEEETQKPFEDNLQSLCYTIGVDTGTEMLCADISIDFTLLAAGFSDSRIHIWSLTGQKLYGMKNKDDLRDIDNLSDSKVYLDKNSGKDVRILCGHSGIVYSLHFTPSKAMLLSSSADCTIRMWSMDTWQIVTVFEDPSEYQIWSVRLSPYGHYFVSCSMDSSFKMWVLNDIKCVRIFVGHTDSVHCVEFHPNSNYVASGSSDCTIRLWDVIDAKMVRIMVGHDKPIYIVIFSKCGRYLVSAAFNYKMYIWDLSTGERIISIKTLTSVILSMTFNGEGNTLTIGGLNSSISIWDFKKLIDDYEEPEKEKEKQKPIMKIYPTPKYMLKTVKAKNAAVMHLTYSNNYLLVVAREYLD